jgi:NADPH:quinone reductase-like Zn-dependent oxidoreductase
VRDHGGVEAGQTVRIVGASGGVGSFAVQIAKAFGAEVTGVDSTAKLDLVRALGADDVIDYTSEEFTDGRHRYDVILDIGGNRRLSHLRRALTPDGRLVIVGGETDGRCLGGTDRQFAGAGALYLRSSETGHLRRIGERRRPGRLTRAHRGGPDQTERSGGLEPNVVREPCPFLFFFFL